MEQSTDVQEVDGVSTEGTVINPPNEEDVALAAPSRNLRSKSKKKENLFKLSQEGRQNLIPATEKDQGGWVFTEEMMQRVSWAKLFATVKTMYLLGNVEFIRPSGVIKVDAIFVRTSVFVSDILRTL